MIEKLLDKWHTKKTSGTPFESLKPEIVVYSSVTTIPIISEDKGKPEDTLYLIQNAPTLEILKTFKVIASSDPSKVLYNAYCERLKYLSA